MTIYDDMRGYVHTHDRNGWFDVATETAPVHQMVDKADAENSKLSELMREMWSVLGYSTECRLVCKHGRECLRENECVFERRMRELGIEATDG